MKKNIAIFASGGGSNLQAVIDACKTGCLNATVCVVISNNSKSGALQRATDAGIPAYHISQKTTDKPDAAILQVLKQHNTEMILLAGYLKKIGESVLREYEGKIYNIHPALLPKYGGQGMFGLNVHQAVINAAETETGITIHKVDPEYDTGETIAQCTVPVVAGDTAETLAARVLEREHSFLVETLRRLQCPQS